MPVYGLHISLEYPRSPVLPATMMFVPSAAGVGVAGRNAFHPPARRAPPRVTPYAR